ncbi:hypothetical protein V6N11_051650 [Hibiscus sabdariffa]|uniref:Uncharacterized protein n=1 Tax=Hibiscus sabdariffa TaxID=183260 RepID=A0ABR2U8F0_9ROSI
MVLDGQSVTIDGGKDEGSEVKWPMPPRCSGYRAWDHGCMCGRLEDAAQELSVVLQILEWAWTPFSL